MTTEQIYSKLKFDIISKAVRSNAFTYADLKGSNTSADYQMAFNALCEDSIIQLYGVYDGKTLFKANSDFKLIAKHISIYHDNGIELLLYDMYNNRYN